MLEIFRHDPGITEIRLNRPPVNAFDPELVSRLQEALGQARQEARAIVISGAPGMFSAGLDVPHLLTLDEAGMEKFWQSFFGVLESIASSPVPVVAALTGHSPAGGAVMALFADYRIMAEGDYRIGLNEVEVGLVVPPVIHRALARLIGPYPAERHLVAGKMITAEQARSIGMVDELVPPENVVERALQWCRRHLELPAHSMNGTRALTRADLIAEFGQADALDIDSFVSGWFEPETQATLKKLVERLKG